ncbi:MAG: hypothetical protein FJ271_04750 [Planctomycetes bacterium]|nr:hypothetical protein [Planctomycetota bacterium]
MTIVVAMQLLLWFFTATAVDAGFAWTVYSCMVLLYWTTVWLIHAIGLVHTRSFAGVVAASGWLPPVACVFWLLWLSGVIGG